MNNPIINNRLVNDRTFAIRLKSFLSHIAVHDLASQEELDYFQRIAQSLIDYQVSTCDVESEEYKYLENLKSKE